MIRLTMRRRRPFSTLIAPSERSALDRSHAPPSTPARCAARKGNIETGRSLAASARNGAQASTPSQMRIAPRVRRFGVNISGRGSGDGRLLFGGLRLGRQPEADEHNRRAEEFAQVQPVAEAEFD